MNLQQLYYFKAIAEEEHYTRAAEKLRITQPSLSYAMSELERELGAPLFRKSGRNIALTQYGSAFLQYANRSLQELENGKLRVREMMNPEAGTIVLSHASSMGTNFIPFIIRRFYEITGNRNIHFEFEQRPTWETVALFERGQIDLGFGSFVQNDDMCFHPLYSEEMVVVVSQQHPLAEKDGVYLNEIVQEELITWDKRCATRPEIDAIFARAKLKPKIAYEVFDETMITGIAAMGLGFGIVPRILGTEYRNVKTLKIKDFSVTRTMYMIWPKNNGLMPAAEAFRQFVMLNMPGGYEANAPEEDV